MSIYDASEEAGAPTSPSATRQLLYPKSGGWYRKNSAGTETRLADSSDLVASSIANTPAGSIVATTVQAAINELDTEKAPTISPTITGTVAGTGAAWNLGAANTTTLATTGKVSIGDGTLGNLVLRAPTDAADQSVWAWQVGSGGPGAGKMRLRCINDAESAGVDFLEFTRSGTTPASLAVTGSISTTTTIKTGGYLVSTLPAGIQGERTYVTDATTPTWNGALTGGGAVVCPVFKNASAWVSA